MSSIRQIPGYYYDYEKNKYFKIVNGATSVDSTKRYHNNAIQSERRSHNISKSKGASKHKNYQIISNPFLKNISSERKAKILKPTLIPSAFDIDGLLYIRSGEISLTSHYYKHDQIEALNTPKFIPEIVPRGEILGQLTQDLVVVHRINIPVIKRSRIIQVPKYLALHNKTTGVVYNIPEHWKFRNGNLVDYLHRNQVYIDQDFVIHDIKPGCSHANLLQVITLENATGSFIKFNRCEGIDFHDYTEDLLLFIQEQTKKVGTPMKKIINELFGINLLCKSDYKSKSIQEINSKLLELQSDISPARKSKIQADIDQFINSKMSNNGWRITYNEDNRLANQRHLIAGCFHHDSLYLVGVGGHIIKITFTKDPEIKFTNLYYTKLNSNSHIGQIHPCEDKLYVSMGESLFKLDSDLPLFGSSSLPSITPKKLLGLRKIFALRPDLLLVISRDEIYYWNNSMKHLITKYDHKNDTCQQIEIIQNHLIYNEGNKFHMINLNRSENNKNCFDIVFNFSKCGYFKDFRLSGMVEMISPTTRLRIGLTFYNQEDYTTIFESYQLP
ncbi:uncharacterized protein SPAPADRAFT_51105 [Spathaspora passalidarum NRRL Y-27907]|uniref:Uncharacterized protein n=1 Tax=Spathaspora passalidarum (strain NRRL Y-27907 / 11-Y1) TaxID=619300 RepID=G3ANN3_SPAPN|nr:uncharacterized protein SPAPADRAFT_51105 [Spathaspora passalidarum NRRL Y-27907]EGW32562.1 hypothetical protein SPAPADRAFT_51105 [Spathaspora passalidarum NRRL Y-27907]